MPTFHRREYIGQAVKYFLRQSYPYKELVIVEDDSPPPLPSWLEEAVDRVQIRYIRLEGRHNVGFLRNAACQEGRGDYIMHWDDDDWMAPRRIEYQLGALLAENSDLCGLRSMLFYNGLAKPSPVAWRYEYPSAKRPWLAGGSLLYKRKIWENNPFADLRSGEDTRFVWGLQPQMNGKQPAILALPDETFYVAMIHPNNTSPKQPHSLYWQPADLGWVRQLMSDDIQFYDNLATKQPIKAETNFKQTSKRASSSDQTPTQGNKVSGSFETFAQPRPCVTVSIPFVGKPDTLRKSVESILAQTYANLRLVVIGDGPGSKIPDLLTEIHDSRLVIFELQENQGRYFADQVVLSATPDAYFMVQDADDWSEPTRLEMLFHALRAKHAQAAFSAQAVHSPTQNVMHRVERYIKLESPLGRQLEHRANHHGLYECAALRAVGGFYAGFRIGYDTLLVNWLLMSGRVTYVNEILYHRLIHSGSLTQSKETGSASIARRLAAAALRQLYEQGFESYERYLVGAQEQAELCSQIRSLVMNERDSEKHALLEIEIERLRAKLQSPVNEQLVLQPTKQPTNVEPSPDFSIPSIKQGFRIIEKHLHHSAPPPTISCILATGNRLGFTRQAIRCFLRQTCDDSELIVVDDGAQSAEELCKDLLRVRYIRLDEPTLLGTKLNIGIQHARGRVIQKLDDDDYYASTFLEIALKYLKKRSENLVSWESFLVLLAGESLVRYSGRGWTTGGTLCFDRSLWERKSFRQVPSQVDTFFIEDNRPVVTKVNEPELYLMVRHKRNTWKTLSSGVGVDSYFASLPMFHRPLQEIVEPLDIDFYTSLRGIPCE